MKVIDKINDPKLAEELKAASEKDVELWEKGDLGKNPAHVKKTSAANDAIMKEAVGSIKRRLKQKPLQPITIKMPPDLLDALRALADANNLAYQSYIKMILTKHVANKRKSEDDI